ncbi:aminoglycoside phosphotransferase family protein [Amycolatopsis balhimycina DSM 5908]|uniref:Aminoglycoside phosphotransferase family protein n=1 Tax=Amycolatopsis balhimycina DSM 5908 TaxID=1081091 RepID=A0A428VZN4_AMYBA|nr:aminoglycoside phosphotransferase family protein [Amycolatopsis balhimycina]RSM36279.1 aminoglycoside phosphotransferase family protein [Amycolatopsis balhimycina DSM 5908]
MDGELIASGIDPASVVTAGEIGGGTYNTAVRLRLADGRRLVLKIAPTAPGLAHEHDLLATEAEYYRLVPGPLPSVVGAGPGFLLMTEVPGVPWHGREVADRPRLRRELGGIVAGLHKVTGEGFGYPQDPLHPTWPAAFTAMVDAVLAGAVRYGVRLPRPAAEIAHLVRRHEPLLALVATPVLVHFDLWDGNILLDDGRVSGIIDAERAFWGDPVAEFVSLTLFRDLDTDLVAGYRAAGGPARFDAPARRRLALYRVYLDLIMLVEMAPRKDGDADRARFVAEHLGRDIDALHRAV